MCSRICTADKGKAGIAACHGCRDHGTTAGLATGRVPWEAGKDVLLLLEDQNLAVASPLTRGVGIVIGDETCVC